MASVLHPLSFWLAVIATGIKEWAVCKHKLEQWDFKVFAGLWDCGICYKSRNSSAGDLCLQNGDLYAVMVGPYRGMDTHILYSPSNVL